MRTLLKDRFLAFLLLMLCFLVALLVALVCTSVQTRAQEMDMEHRHALGHGEYQNWASGKTNNCCNNEDCHFLTKDEYRETVDGPELRVSNKWCPVKPEHYTIRGKSPDWSHPHACINKNTNYQDECDRILCFMREGGT